MCIGTEFRGLGIALRWNLDSLLLLHIRTICIDILSLRDYHRHP